MVRIPFVSPYPGVSTTAQSPSIKGISFYLIWKKFGTKVYDKMLFPIFAFLFLKVVGWTIYSPDTFTPTRGFPTKAWPIIVFPILV